MEQKSSLKAGMHLSPVSRLAVRIARAHGFSATSCIVMFSISPAAVRRICQDVPTPPSGQPDPGAETVLREITLAELGAEPEDLRLWIGMKHAAQRVLVARSTGTTAG